MTDVPIASHSFCVVPGCSSPTTTTRWVRMGDEEPREVEVCSKHAEGELSAEDLDPSHSGG
ncbi:MAG TPA: hypothetical protein VMQ46_02195 [Acidimicrobiia bacterium]|nr:hypothetical protein [Acidimicrobiia bacterium]